MIYLKKRKEIKRRYKKFKQDIIYLKGKLIKLEKIKRDNNKKLKKFSKLKDAGIINKKGIVQTIRWNNINVKILQQLFSL